MEIRFASTGDASLLLEIYARYMDTPITFEYRLPSQQEFSERIANMSAFYPYVLCEDAGKVVGYAYAHRHMEREAYQWGAELSVYLAPAATSKGLGKKLYSILIEILKLQGIRTVYGGVTLPNEKSEKLHAAMGFDILGTYNKAGYKNGKWHDVRWFEKQIAEYGNEPLPVIPITALPKEQLYQIISFN